MLSVAQITTRLSDDKSFVSQLGKIFDAKLTEKQGPIMLYRRMIKDFSPDELETMPIPGSKPPEKPEAGLNALYDYYPERTQNGEKIPAGYRWNDIADGLNNDNILLKERIGKYLSKKTEQAERNAIPGADVFRTKSSAQLENMQATARERQNSFRTNVKRAFNLSLQIQRIDDDYPSVDVMFDVDKSAEPDTDGYHPLNSSSAPIFVVSKDNPMIGQPMSVASFLRLNVDKALADPRPGKAGTYDALIESAGKSEAETPIGEGGGVDLISNEQADGYIAQLARFVDGKRGIEALTHMLTSTGSDELLLSLADFFYTVDGLMKGSLNIRATRLMEERDARNEKEKQDKLAKDSDVRKARTEATLDRASAAT